MSECRWALEGLSRDRQHLRETTPVGRYRGNAWGAARHAPATSGSGAATATHQNLRDGFAPRLAGGVDPRGPSAAPDRVFRGGCWHDSGSNLRSGGPRHWVPPGDSAWLGLGFRVALVRTDPERCSQSANLRAWGADPEKGVSLRRKRPAEPDPQLFRKFPTLSASHLGSRSLFVGPGVFCWKSCNQPP